MQAFVPTSGVSPQSRSTFTWTCSRAAACSRSRLAESRRAVVAPLRRAAPSMSSNDYLSKIDKLSPNNLQTGSFAAADVGFEPASVATGYGGGSVGGSGSGSGSGGGGGGGGDSSGRGGERGEGSGDEVTLAAMLAKMKMTMADVPADVRRAYEGGLVGAEVVGNFLLARANWLSRFLMGTTPGMRNRFLADRFFLLKIMIEEGMGIAGKLGAEYERRRENFFKEGEFVFANLITALLADFALVYLPAPSVALEKTAAGTSWFKRLATDLPSNIFQTDRAFTLSQRGAGFALKAGQLFAVGFMCSIIGAAMTNGLVYVREKVDKNYKPKTAKTNVFAVSLLYATFLGLSSGSRYQLVNGIENHIFPRVFAKAPVLLEQVSTFLLRYGNTFWGSQQWVIFCRMTNVQKLATE